MVRVEILTHFLKLGIPLKVGYAALAKPRRWQDKASYLWPNRATASSRLRTCNFLQMFLT